MKLGRSTPASGEILERAYDVSRWQQDHGEDTSIAHKNLERLRCQLMAQDGGLANDYWR